MIVNGRRAAAQNNAGRPIALDFIQWGGTRQDDGKYFEFADAARNELRVLRTEVENDDGLFFHEQLFSDSRQSVKVNQSGEVFSIGQPAEEAATSFGPAASTCAAAKARYAAILDI